MRAGGEGAGGVAATGAQSAGPGPPAPPAAARPAAATAERKQKTTQSGHKKTMTVITGQQIKLREEELYSFLLHVYNGTVFEEMNVNK